MSRIHFSELVCNVQYLNATEQSQANIQISQHFNSFQIIAILQFKNLVTNKLLN